MGEYRINRQCRSLSTQQVIDIVEIRGDHGSPREGGDLRDPRPYSRYTMPDGRALTRVSQTQLRDNVTGEILELLPQ